MLKKSLTQRAAEAVKKNSSSADLAAIKSEIVRRISEVEAELRTKEREIEIAVGDGDLEGMRAIRQAETSLKDESRILHHQSGELHRAIQVAKGSEAMAAAKDHSKKLAATLEKAQKAQAMLAECQQAAREVITARMDAAYIGEKLVFDASTIRRLAAAIYPEGSNEYKQAMLDLGIADANRTAA
jgi:hypothetical protein